jgi:hypothetical protein
MNMKKFLEKIFGASTIGLMFQAGTTVQFQPLTQGTNALGPTLSGLIGGSNSSLAGFFNTAFTMALSAGAILAVLRLAYAGWLYMGAADMWGSKQHAKEVIMDAVLGLLLLIGIYIVLAQINPNILNLNILNTIQNAPINSPSAASSNNSSTNSTAAPNDATGPAPCPAGTTMTDVGCQ